MDERHRIGHKNVLKKEAVLILLIAFLLFVFCRAPIAYAYNRVSAVVLMDGEGTVLYAENAGARMEIASTTKILTAITVIENYDIFAHAIIPREAVGVEGSSVYLREGEEWSILDLLYGLMLRSGNDAAVALAVASAGNVDTFAEKMNATARKAGATDSHFVNPHGLHDAEHYSTAEDMARITVYALKCPIFAAICKTKAHRYEKRTGDGTEKGIFYNKNKLLYSYVGATGVKTGYTKHSGRCLVASAERDGRTLVCVTLNVYDTYGVTRSLFDRYFASEEK